MDHMAVGQLSRMICMMNELRRPASLSAVLELPKGLNISQMETLMYLLHHEHKEEGVFQKDIEAFLRIRRSSVSSLLQNMEKSGWILRLPVPQDARLKWLVLTAQGRELCGHIQTYRGRLEDYIAQILDPQELETFANLVGKLIDHLDAFHTEGTKEA